MDASLYVPQTSYAVLHRRRFRWLDRARSPDRRLALVGSLLSLMGADFRALPFFYHPFWRMPRCFPLPVRLLAAEIPLRAGDGSASTWGTRMHDTQSSVESVAYQKTQ